MEMAKKETYAVPECKRFEWQLEGMIAASADPQDYVNPFGPEIPW